jgi:uncharacterized integral membrane protein
MTAVPDLPPDHDELDHVLRRRRRLALRGILYLAIVVIVFAFVIENSQRVTVHFWFFTHKARLIWVVLACLAAGTVLGYLVGFPERRARRRRRKAEKAARRHRGSDPERG